MSRRRCDRCGARLSPPGTPCTTCGNAALEVQWETSAWSPQPVGAAAGEAGSAGDREHEQQPARRTSLVIALAGVLILAAGGLAIGLASGSDDDHSDDNVAGPLPTQVLPTVAPALPSATPSTAPSATGQPPRTFPLPQARSGPTGSIGPIAPPGLPIGVWLNARPTGPHADYESYPAAISVDLDTGAAVRLDSSPDPRLLPRSLSTPGPPIVAVHDTTAGLIFVTMDGRSSTTRLRAEGLALDTPGITVHDGYQVAPDGTVWVFHRKDNRLQRFRFGATEADVTHLVDGRAVDALVGIDGMANPVVALRDGTVVAVPAEADDPALPIADGWIHAVAGEVVVRTRCDASLACRVHVTGPAWDDGPTVDAIVYSASISPRGDAVVLHTDLGVLAVTPGDEAVVITTQAWWAIRSSANGRVGSWTSDGAYYVTSTEARTLVVWEVDAQGLSWFNTPPDLSGSLIGIVPHLP